MNVVVGARSDTGLVRHHNEDSYYAGHRIWAVADGLGGQAAGDVASAIVTDQLRSRDEAGPLVPDDIARLISTINEAIVDYGWHNPDATGLCSTISGIASVEIGGMKHWSVFNVGDTRVYRFANNLLTRKTVDHNEAQELIDMGQLSPADSANHPLRSVLTRALGTTPAPQPDILLLPKEQDETFLICSDGLTSEVPDETIAAVLGDCRDPEQAAGRLVDLTMAQGAHDNVTVLVLAVRDDDADWAPDGTTIPRPTVQEL